MEVEWEKKLKNHTDYHGRNGNELPTNAYFKRF